MSRWADDMAEPSNLISEAASALGPTAWVEALSTLGPFLGVAAMLAVWQLWVIQRIDNRRLRTWMICGSSVLILGTCLFALMVGYLKS